MLPVFILCVCFLISGHADCDKLEALRKKMAAAGLDAFIVPNSDYHGSETPAERDKRREWISSFSGSNGDVVVSKEQAVLFTDSRYTIQAKRQLSQEWKLAPKDSKLPIWISKNLPAGSKIGADPKTIPFKLWLDIKKITDSNGMFLKESRNFIDELWTDRPPLPNKALFIHEFKYTGMNYSDKVMKTREFMLSANVTALALTALDDVAWLLNLRGGDSPYTPIFHSFVILHPTNGTLYVRPEVVSPEIRDYLTHSDTPFSIKDYDDFWRDWAEIGKTCEQSGYVTNHANYFVFSAVPDSRRKEGPSPIVDLRAFKTPEEVEGSRAAHVLDGAAVCQLIKALEEQLVGERYMSETDVVHMSFGARAEVKSFRGRSFPDVVAAGANSALPHYVPVTGKGAKINASTILLIDSGGQYPGGTTDITRVVHFGNPRPIEIEVYTRLLKGVIRLASAVFPEGTPAKNLDTILRMPLYQVGLSYGHGSTHGTGVYLNVHEDFNGTYYENFIGSQEPGYYEEGEFGMRLENLVVVVPAETKYKGKTDKRLMTFSPLTLVPYETKLINASIMDESELEWLNNYHKVVRELVGDELKRREKNKLYEWLEYKTEPIDRNTKGRPSFFNRPKAKKVVIMTEEIRNKIYQDQDKEKNLPLG